MCGLVFSLSTESLRGFVSSPSLILAHATCAFKKLVTHIEKKLLEPESWLISITFLYLIAHAWVTQLVCCKYRMPNRE